MARCAWITCAVVLPLLFFAFTFLVPGSPSSTLASSSDMVQDEDMPSTKSMSRVI